MNSADTEYTGHAQHSALMPKLIRLGIQTEKARMTHSTFP